MDFSMKHASVIIYHGNCCLCFEASSYGRRNDETIQL